MRHLARFGRRIAAKACTAGTSTGGPIDRFTLIEHNEAVAAFGIVAICGEAATAVGLTGWSEGDALRAADRAYLLRGGERIAEGPTGEIMTQARLEELYGAPVRVITDGSGTAFVPG